MSNTGSTDNFGYSQELKRELSFKDVFVYGMLFMVVIAPMSIYGYISKDSHMMRPSSTLWASAPCSSRL